MTNTTAVTGRGPIARPLKTLAPLIKQELEAGDQAGLEHYRRAGAMLNEAKEQLAHGAWGRWLSQHFALSSRQALRYMTLARHHGEAKSAPGGGYGSLKEAIGEPQHRPKEAWRGVFQAVQRVDTEALQREARSRAAEQQTRVKLALQMIDVGYKALATRLHPDRGGSRDAMARLNDVRDQLKEAATTRRYV